MNTGVSEKTVAGFLFGEKAAQFRVQSSFIKIVSEGDLSKVKAYVQLGYDVDEKDHAGKSALMHSIERGHDSVFDYLLANGATITALDDKHKSVADYIVEKRNRRYFQKLLEKGLMKSATGVDQTRKALKLAADKRFEGMRELIVRAFQQDRARRGAFKN